MSSDGQYVARYAAAVQELRDVLVPDGPTLTADEDGAAVGQDTALEDAVDGYAAASQALFDASVDSEIHVALASLGGDLRVVAELAALDSGPLLIADETPGSDFSADMRAVVAAAAGKRAAPVVVVAAGAADAAEVASASIDAISAVGREHLQAVARAAVLPDRGDLGAAVRGLLGGGAGEVFDRLVATLSGWRDRILRAAARLLRKVAEKVVALLGGAAADKLRDWLVDLLDPAKVYEAALGVQRLQSTAAQVLSKADDAEVRAGRIATVADEHASDQRWIGWGTKALGWAGPKLRGLTPWGPPAVLLVSLALVLACAWLTADHLDSYDVAWLPDRVRGVGAALA